MKCPNCKSENLSTFDSRPEHGNNAVRRRKKCLDCSYRWTTKEITDSMYQFYESQLKRLYELEQFQQFSSTYAEKGSKGFKRGTGWSKSETDKLIVMYFDQLPLKEIAESLGRSYMSVNKRLQFLRKRDKLKKAN